MAGLARADPPGRRLRPEAAQVLLEAVQHVLRGLVRGATSRLGVGDQHELLADVVERDQRAVEGERRARQRALGVPRRQPLEQPHRVVAEIADRAAREARQFRQLRRGPADALAELRQQVAVENARALAPELAQHRPSQLERRQRIAAEERVARQPLAADDALEQERSLGACAERQEGGDGRQQVGGDLTVDGNQAAAGGEPLVLLEGQRVHSCTPSPKGRET